MGCQNTFLSIRYQQMYTLNGARLYRRNTLYFAKNQKSLFVDTYLSPYEYPKTEISIEAFPIENYNSIRLEIKFSYGDLYPRKRKIDFSYDCLRCPTFLKDLLEKTFSTIDLLRTAINLLYEALDITPFQLLLEFFEEYSLISNDLDTEFD